MRAKDHLVDLAEDLVLVLAAEAAVSSQTIGQLLQSRTTLRWAANEYSRIAFLCQVAGLLEQAHLCEAGECGQDGLLQARVQHGQASLRVQVLDANVQLLGESLLLDDQVLAAELLHSCQGDQIRVNEGQDRVAEVVEEER